VCVLFYLFWTEAYQEQPTVLIFIGLHHLIKGLSAINKVQINYEKAEIQISEITTKPQTKHYGKGTLHSNS
jgi:hypothetical protein